MSGALLMSRAGVVAARPAAVAPRASTSAPSSSLAAVASRRIERRNNTGFARASVVAAAAAAEADVASSDEEEGAVPERRSARAGGGRGGGGRGGRGRGEGGGRGRGRDGGGEDDKPEFQERVVQVSRVTKVCTGGKQLSFRAVVVVGDENGKVGVGTATAKEVVNAVQKAVIAAKKEMITVPLTRGATFPHRADGIFGAARVMLRPASEGTGVIAGGAVRVVLELAGVKNAFGKQLGSGNPLNNARAAVEGLRTQRTFEMVAQERGLSVAQMLQHKSA